MQFFNAMILAAGMGERLRPYSLLRPKPLFPVLDRPLLKLIIEKLRQDFSSAGDMLLTRIIVNACHLRGQIADTLQPEQDIIVQMEDNILGTGGGLRKALPVLGHEPVLVTNGDIYHDIDYSRVYRYHREAGNPVTLVLHDCARFNQVAVSSSGRVLGFGEGFLKSAKDGAAGHIKPLAFTGIHVIEPEVLKIIPEDSFFSIIDCYREVIRRGGVIQAYVAEGCFWTDIGTPADYLGLHKSLLTGAGRWTGTAGPCASSPFFISPGSAIGRDVILNGWVSIGTGARVNDGASLARVVVWDGAEVESGAILTDCIVT